MPTDGDKALSRQKKLSSAESQRTLGAFILIFGRTMPRSCSYCQQRGLECKVHIRSGFCGECNKNNRSGCNVRVTKKEWSRIKSERERLLKELAAAAEARKDADAARERAEKARQVAVENELRLRGEMFALEEEAEEAIATEEARVALLTQDESEGLLESSEVPPSDVALPPFLLSAEDTLTDPFDVFALFRDGPVVGGS